MDLRAIGLMLLMCFTAANAHGAVDVANLADKVMPAFIFKRLFVSPAVPVQGDLVRDAALDEENSIKVVVKSPLPSPSNNIVYIPAPNADMDATPVFERAFQQAKAFNAPAKIVLTPGTYFFKTLLDENKFWFLRDISDLTVVGNGAKLVFRQSGYGLSFNNVKRVKVSNLTIKYEGFPMASLATAVKLNKKMYLKLDNEFAANNGAPVKAINYISKNTTQASKMIWQPQPWDDFYVPEITAIWDPNVNMYLVGLPNDRNNIRYMLRHTVYGPAAVQTTMGGMSEDITLDKLTINNSPGMGIIGLNIERGLAVTNCTLKPDANDKMMLISAAADGLHIGHIGGDILIENNDFSLMGDDAINMKNGIYYVGKNLTNSRTESTFTLAPDAGMIREGSVLALYDKKMNFLGMGLAKTASIFSKSAPFKRAGEVNPTTLFYDVKVSSILKGAEYGQGVHVDNLSDVAFVRDTSLPGARFYVARNNFHDHRARGMLIQIPVGVVEYNRLSHQTMAAGIVVLSDVKWWMEGYGVSYVTLRKNTISDSKGSGGYAGGISVTSDMDTLQNIRIEDNIVTNIRYKSCIDADHALRLTILNNTCDKDISIYSSLIVTAKGNKFSGKSKVGVSGDTLKYSGQ